MSIPSAPWIIDDPPYDPAQNRDIFHTAFLLRQKLPADIVPAILEYAECWQTIRKRYTYTPFQYVSGDESPRLQAGMVVPYSVRPGSVHSITFMITSCDDGGELDYPDEYWDCSEEPWGWFEAGITDGSEMLLPCNHHRYDGNHVWLCEAKPAKHLYGGERVGMEPHFTPSFENDWWIWYAYDGWDINGALMTRALRGGYGIEVSAYSMFPNFGVYTQSIAIEILYAPVTRM